MAGPLDRTDYIKVAHIEAWADESVTMHRRECSEKVCGGKSKMWWIVRHPKINPVVSNKTARKMIVENYHVCREMLRRLEGGSIPWLPHERNTYSKREPEEISRLLDREDFSSKPTSDADSDPDPVKNPEVYRDPFPEVRKSFPETKTERLRREAAEHSAQPVAHKPKQPQPNGMNAAVDALTRRG